MKKILLFLIGTTVVLALIVLIGGNFFLGSMVKAGVNEFGPRLTQTKVELASASISPVSGDGTLSGLFVGNPPGWTSDKAFYLGQVHVSIAPGSLFKDHIVINEIVIDQPEFVYETKLVSSNIGDLMKNIEAATGGGKKPAGPVAKDGKQRKFEVKKFTLRNGKVTIGVGATATTLSMPAIELTDIGTREGGITADQVASTVMRSVTAGVISSSTLALMKTMPTMGSAAGDALKKAGEGLQKMLGGEKK
jgi:uncharacterized protein involved in outer membrane biogenesis